MPLVPLNTVHRWYQRDSWVYRNFEYLFNNPLWNKNVPNGFSLCPYFWLAIFSMTIFRGFVYAVLGFRIITKPVGKLVHKTDIIIAEFFIGDDDPSFGIPSMLATAMLFTVSCFGYMIYTIIVAYIGAGILSALIVPLTLLITLIVCGKYAAKNHHKEDRCKVENYVRIAVLVGIGLMWWLHPIEFAIVCSGVLKFIDFAFIGFIVHVYHSICVGCHSLWGLIINSSHFIWASLISFSSVLLWVVLAFGALSFIGWMFKYCKDGSNPLHEKANNYKAKYDELINEVVVYVRYQDDGKCYKYDYELRNDRKYWEQLVRNVPEVTSMCHTLAIDNGTISAKQITKAIKAVNLTHEVVSKIEQERHIKRLNICHKVSSRMDGIANVVAICTYRYPLKVFVWVVKEVWTFICLLIELIKAKKQGACPYLKFTDPKKKVKK